MQPFLKWAGGKRQLLKEIIQHVPERFTTYYEPFLGGGAVFFEIQPPKAIVNDINAEVINVYHTIQTAVESLIEDLKRHKNDADYYYQLRKLDREPAFASLSAVEKASRIIYLNKTCYNGLFRVNRQGQFNVPFGRYKNPNIVNEAGLLAVSHYLNANDVTILNTDFATSIQKVERGAFVYLDPPYDLLSNSSSFTGYTRYGFNKDEQIRLKLLCDSLHQKGCQFLLSNSATDFIFELYKDYNMTIVKANRHINSLATGRGKIDEVLIKNY